MKNYFYIIITMFTVLSSCKKEETDTTAYTAVSVYNASPTLATYDVYINDLKSNAAALPFGGGFAYQQRVAGSYNFKFTIAGRTEIALNQTVGLAQSTYFSYYLVGRSAALEGVMFSDDLTGTSTTKAYIRFINLSPDAPALDLAVKSGATLTTKNAYKTASAFVAITAGTYSFDVKDNATAAVKAALTDIKLVAGGHYTVISKGLVTPITNVELPFSAQLIIQQ